MGLTNLETRLSQREANPQILHSPRNPSRRFAGIHADEDIVLRVERPNLAVATRVRLFFLASRSRRPSWRLRGKARMNRAFPLHRHPGQSPLHHFIRS